MIKTFIMSAFHFAIGLDFPFGHLPMTGTGILRFSRHSGRNSIHIPRQPRAGGRPLPNMPQNPLFLINPGDPPIR
jgi:hypothetical protein